MVKKNGPLHFVAIAWQVIPTDHSATITWQRLLGNSNPRPPFSMPVSTSPQLIPESWNCAQAQLPMLTRIEKGGAHMGCQSIDEKGIADKCSD